MRSSVAGGCSRGLAAPRCPSLSGFGELAITLGEDRRFAAGELVGGCDVADRAAPSHVLVVFDEAVDESSRFVEREGQVVPQAIAFERAVPALELAVGLRVVGTRSDVGNAVQADELPKIFGQELRAVVGDHARGLPRELFSRSLQDGFHVLFGRALTQFPVNKEAAAAIQHAHQIE